MTSNTHKLSLLSLLIVLCCLFLVIQGSTETYADGYAGGGVSGSTAKCKSYPCYSGATWIYFEIISSSGDIKVAGQEINTGCREYGGFWFAFKRWASKEGGDRYLSQPYSTLEGGKDRVNTSYINPNYNSIGNNQYDPNVVNPLGTISDTKTLIGILENGYKVYNGGDIHKDNISWFCAGDTATFTGSSSAPSSVSGATWDSTNSRFVGSVNTETYTVTFSHTITRTDDGSPTNATAYGSIREYNPSSASANETTTTSPSLAASNSDTKTSSSTVKVSAGKSVEVCQDMSYTKKRFYDTNGDVSSGKDEYDTTSKACVTIYRPLVVEAEGETKAAALGIETSAAKTHSDPRNTSIAPAGGSRVTSYSIAFQHRITITGYNNKKISFGFNIDRKIGSGSWTNVATGTKELSTSDNGTANAILRSNANSKYNFSLPNFGDKLEVCERLTLYDNYQTFTNASDSSPASKSSTGKTSMSCATITRDTPKRHYITATSKVADDLGVDYTNKPNDVSYDFKGKRTAKFLFNLTNDYNGNLSTNYGIDYKINGSESIDYRTGSTNTPGPIMFNPTITLEPGEKVQVCARIHFNPADYYAHTQGGGLEGLNVTRYSDDTTATNKMPYRCIWFGRPAPVEFPDPGITVTAESSAAIKNSNEAVLDENIGAYVVKSADVNVSYYHQFERGDVRHTDKAKTPTEDVSVNYRFYRPNHDFSSKELNSTYIKPNLTIKNNSKSAVFESNQTDKLKNDNTHITGLNVSKDPQEVCQSVHYLSDKYESYGTYLAVDGVRLDQLAPNLPGAGDLISSRVARTNSVGKSSKACVKLIRPFNFKVPSITTPGNTTPANPSAPVNATFTINVKPNKEDFLLTDLPKSPESQVELISFVVSGKPGDGDLAGSANVDSSPCNYFGSKLGGKISSCDDSKTTSLSSHNNNKFYTSSSYTIAQTFSTRIPDTLNISDKFCLAIAVKPTSSNSNGSYGFSGSLDNRRTISNATCFNIGKYPSFQSWGGSIYTKGGTETSTSTASSSGVEKTFGSWADFMIIAKKQVKNTASGAALISGLTNFTDCTISPLTVANSACKNDDRLGFSNLEVSSDLRRGIFERYITGSGKYYDIGDQEQAGSSHIIRTSTLNNASSLYPILIYNSDSNHKNIYIEDNVDTKMSDRTYTDIAVPQVIIYSEGDIYINSSVKRIDAWLLAKGTIYTCANASGNSLRTARDAKTCQEPLEVNGPVVADRIVFDRTYGGNSHEADGSSSITTPAERFDFNPAAFLFGSNEASEDAQPVTTYLHELPPRY